MSRRNWSPSSTALVPGAADDGRVAAEDSRTAGIRTGEIPATRASPTTLAWKLPPGFAASDIEWPAPRALPVGPLVNHGYEGEVLHLVTITPPADATPGTDCDARRARRLAGLQGDVHPRRRRSHADAAGRDRGASRRRVGSARSPPRAPRCRSRWPAGRSTRAATARDRADTGRRRRARADPGNAAFLPVRAKRGSSRPARRRWRARGRRVRADAAGVEPARPASSARLTGVLTAANGLRRRRHCVNAATIDVPLIGAVVAGPKPKPDAAPVLDVSAGARRAAATSMTLVAALALALVGGLILNLMPCVFPVLSLKALSLAAPGHSDGPRCARGRSRSRAGVVVTFVALAGALLALRAAGEQLGWGFQLQSPAVVTALALLFFVLALNLSGVFEFGALCRRAAAAPLANPHADAFLLRRARRRHRVAVHGAVHGRRARLRAGRAGGRDARRVRRARRRHGAAVRAAVVVPRMAAHVAAARRMDGAAEAAAGVPAVRDRRVARVGARRAGRQRRGGAPAGRRSSSSAFALWAWRAFRGGGARAFGVAALDRARRRRRRRVAAASAAMRSRPPRPQRGARRVRYGDGSRGRRRASPSCPRRQARCSSTSPRRGA